MSSFPMPDPHLYKKVKQSLGFFLNASHYKTISLLPAATQSRSKQTFLCTNKILPLPRIFYPIFILPYNVKQTRVCFQFFFQTIALQTKTALPVTPAIFTWLNNPCSFCCSSFARDSTSFII